MKKKILYAMLFLSLLVGGAFATFYVLLSRTPKMLVMLQNFDAKIVPCTPALVTAADSGDETDRWNRTDAIGFGTWSDDHHYVIALTIFQMTQIDNGTLIVNATVPDYLNITIEYIGLQYTTSGGAFVEVEEYASDVALGTVVYLDKTKCLWDWENDKRFIAIVLSEYQIAPAGEGIFSLDLDTTIELGLDSYGA